MPPRPSHILDEDTLLATDAQQASPDEVRWFALDDHPTTLRLGPGALDALHALSRDGTPTLLVTTPNTLARHAWTPPHAWHRFLDFSPNPTPAQIDAAGRLLLTRHLQRVVVLGGGSAMDLGKASALLTPALPTEAALRHALTRGHQPTRTVRLLHVPTTAGTGAEVTPFASIWPPDAPKHSLDTPAALADMAWLDPALTATMPPALTAITALDATVHAIEATLGVHTTPRARRLASRALALITPTLPDALATTPPTLAQRATLQLAATLAGAALAITRSAAAHALSYTLTAHHHVPHGLAVALLMRDLLPLQAQLAPEAIQHILATTEHPDVPALQAWFTTTLQRAGLPTSLAALGLTTADIERLARDATQSVRLQNNPGPPSYEGLVGALASPLPSGTPLPETRRGGGPSEAQ